MCTYFHEKLGAGKCQANTTREMGGQGGGAEPCRQVPSLQGPSSHLKLLEGGSQSRTTAHKREERREEGRRKRKGQSRRERERKKNQKRPEGRGEREK
jgi:hypothetical protein